MKKIIFLLASFFTLYSVTALANIQDIPPECPSSALLLAKYPIISAEKDPYFSGWLTKTANITDFFNGNLYIRVTEAKTQEEAIQIANQIEKTSSQWNGSVEQKSFETDDRSQFIWICSYKIDDAHVELADDMFINTPRLTK